MSNTILLFAASSTFIAIVVGVLLFKRFQKRRLKRKYTEALFGNDRQKAIDAGTAYYRHGSHQLSATAKKAIIRDLDRNGLSNQHSTTF